jgi:(heptosyl)LPS beta-1,4-glucosyltransferase
MAISAVINTYNEAEKLRDCLKSLKEWVDEILVVDMGSKDETLELAKRAGAKILKHELVPYVELIRNWGAEKATGDWILVLDPDERIPRRLAQKLSEIVKGGKFDAVSIPRKNIIFGRWIRHTNWWPDKHVRFFRKGKVSWTNKIHAVLEAKGTLRVAGKVLRLEALEDLAIEHLNYDSVNQFLERQNRYSEIAALNRFDAGERFSWKNFFWKPLRVFLQRYVRHAGFLDGFYGLTLSILACYVQLSEEVKLWEKTKSKSS